MHKDKYCITFTVVDSNDYRMIYFPSTFRITIHLTAILSFFQFLCNINKSFTDIVNALQKINNMALRLITLKIFGVSAYTL